MNKFLYTVIRIIAWPIVMLCLMPKIYNRQYLNIKSKCIVISNHTTYWDPILIGTIVYPPVHFMAKKELIKSSFANKFLTGMGIVPVSRGKNDLKAVKQSIKLLNSNEVLGIYPEGTRSKTGKLLPFESGVTVLATKTNTPVLPIYVHKNGIHPGHRVIVNVGSPINITDKFSKLNSNEDIEKATEYLRNIMLDLRKEVSDE